MRDVLLFGPQLVATTRADKLAAAVPGLLERAAPGEEWLRCRLVAFGGCW